MVKQRGDRFAARMPRTFLRKKICYALAAPLVVETLTHIVSSLGEKAGVFADKEIFGAQEIIVLTPTYT